MSDDIRGLIVSTALSKRNEDGAGPEEYAGHIKIYEQDQGGAKSRFVILSCEHVTQSSTSFGSAETLQR